jgi:general secretion pathway protein K
MRALLQLRHQSGVALITALLVVSLASILAISLVEHLNYDIRRTENILRLDQAQLYNDNAVEFGRGLLRSDRVLNNEFDTLTEYSTANEQTFPVDNGTITASLLDLQGCFNINNLSKTNPSAELARNKLIFRTLLSKLEVDAALHNTLTDSLIDWLDKDDINEQQGAEFDYYIGLDSPYRTANGLMVSPTELRLVKGYTQEIIEGLTKYICVLPKVNTRININTARLQMLESISDLAPHASKIIEYRDGNPEDPEDDEPFATLDDFKRYAKDTLKIQNYDPTGLQVYSEYFMLESYTQLGAGEIHLFSLIYRDQQDGQSQLIHQSRGTL